MYILLSLISGLIIYIIGMISHEHKLQHNYNKELQPPTYIVKDPHHNGSLEYSLINGQFYKRKSARFFTHNTNQWKPIYSIHTTPQRVKALHSLLK